MDELTNEEFTASEPMEADGVTAEPIAAAQPAPQPAPAPAVAPVCDPAPAPTPAFDFDGMKKIIDAHFANVINVVRYVKEKDANVLTLSKQMQSYRDGFEQTLFKRIALDLIGYREDCRKSSATLTPGSVNAERVDKYIDYLAQDLEDILTNNGVEQADNGEYTYNGRPMVGDVERVTFRDPPEPQAFELPQADITDEAGLIAYLKECEQTVAAAVKYNAVLDSVLADYINASKVYERSLSQVLLFPVFRKIISLCEFIRNSKTEPENADRQPTDKYASVLTDAIAQTRAILELCNVYVDDEVPMLTDYDPRRHRSIKLNITDDPELNGKVTNRSTDCYVMDDKVIYPAKVELYKSK